MSTITIFHNPVCGTSRTTLALIRHSGVEPEIVEYLKTPPGKTRLQALVAAMGIPVRSLLRAKEAAYTELGLDNPALTDDQLFDAMVAHPILMNRPIVQTSLGTKLCRPFDEVLEILPHSLPSPFVKTDGTVVEDHGRRRS